MADITGKSIHSPYLTRPEPPMQHSTVTPVICTVQPHPTGGYSPTVHLAGTPAPAPLAWAQTFPSIERAVQWAKDHYGVLTVNVVTPDRHAA